MSTSPNLETTPEPVAVRVTDDVLSVDLVDGRTISVPLAWYPRLLHATPAERQNYELSYVGIHWEDLNEDISVEGLLAGRKSGESLRSLERWMEYRSRGEREPIPTFPLPADMVEELRKIPGWRDDTDVK